MAGAEAVAASLTGERRRMFQLHPAAMHVRTAFLSDIHLGARECRADLVLDFLHRVRMERLFLVGDIVDVWGLRRSFYWPQSHHSVLRTILGMAKHGTRVIYVPGNHDEEFRDLDGAVFGNLAVHREYVHTTAAGRRMLVAHGDEFDANVKFSRWLAALGSGMYDYHLRRAMGLPYWSLAGYLKARVGNAMKYVRLFEEAATHAAQRRGFDGIICGHVHRPANNQQGGVRYCNSGDWVENCSALIEDHAGELRLWQLADWSQAPARAAPLATAA
jgi:UDP-2,3-diacylglucosamine pyrophosphatase LpxH